MLQRQKSLGFYVVGSSVLLVKESPRGSELLVISTPLMCFGFSPRLSRTTVRTQSTGGPALCALPRLVKV